MRAQRDLDPVRRALPPDPLPAPSPPHFHPSACAQRDLDPVRKVVEQEQRRRKLSAQQAATTGAQAAAAAAGAAEGPAGAEGAPDGQAGRGRGSTAAGDGAGASGEGAGAAGEARGGEAGGEGGAGPSGRPDARAGPLPSRRQLSVEESAQWRKTDNIILTVLNLWVDLHLHLHLHLHSTFIFTSRMVFKLWTLLARLHGVFHPACGPAGGPRPDAQL